MANSSFDALPVMSARSRVLSCLALLLCATGLLTAWALDSLKNSAKDHIQDDLQNALRSSSAALHYWSEGLGKEVRALAADARIREGVMQTLPSAREPRPLIAPSQRAQLREFLPQATPASKAIDTLLASAEGINLFAMHEDKVGVRNIVAQYRKDLFQRMHAGETLFVPPIRIHSLPSQLGSEAFETLAYMGSPVFDAQGRVAAVLLRSYDPRDDFKRILSQSRTGKSGETYALDGRGRMLNPSRFPEQLVAKGLARDQQAPGLGLKVRVPQAQRLFSGTAFSEAVGGELTYMAKRLIAGDSDFSLDGYENYLGNKVVGRWHWNAALGLGLAHEMAYAEAFESYFESRRWLLLLASVAVLIAVFYSVLTLRLGKASARYVPAPQHERWQPAQHGDERGSQVSSAFLAKLSHEMRTPMNAIVGYTQMLQGESSLALGQRKHVDLIAKSSEHLLGLIDHIQDWSKLDAGKMALQEVEFDLPQLLDEVYASFESRAAHKGIALYRDQQGSLPRYVRADAARLRQILRQLCSHALQFAADGKLRWQQHAQQQTGGQMALELALEAAGMGSTLNDTEGVGLDLSLCHKLAELMQGELCVEQHPQGGRRMVLRLPVQLSRQASLLVKGANRPVGLEPAFARPSVLVVDDDGLSRELLVQVLAPLGFQLLQATNGHDAVAHFERHQPSIIIIDLLTSLLDAVPTIRRIRASEGGAAPFIIACTASELGSECTGAAEHGADRLLHKPLPIAEMLQLLSELEQVHFVYAASSSFAPQGRARLDAGASDLDALPATLRTRLAEAAGLCDLATLRTLSGEISALSPQAARIIDELLLAYQFERIQELLTQGQDGAR